MRSRVVVTVVAGTAAVASLLWLQRQRQKRKNSSPESAHSSSTSTTTTTSSTTTTSTPPLRRGASDAAPLLDRRSAEESGSVGSGEAKGEARVPGDSLAGARVSVLRPGIVLVRGALPMEAQLRVAKDPVSCPPGPVARPAER